MREEHFLLVGDCFARKCRCVLYCGTLATPRFILFQKASEKRCVAFHSVCERNRYGTKLGSTEELQ